MTGMYHMYPALPVGI